MDFDPPRSKPNNLQPRVGGTLMLGWGVFSVFFGGLVLCTTPFAALSGEELAVVLMAMVMACVHVLVGLLNIAAGIQLRWTNYPGLLSWVALLSNFGTCLFCGWISVLVISIAGASFLTAKRETPF